NVHNVQKQYISDKLVKEIVYKISPDFSVFPSMSNLIEENDYYFNRMTNEQNYLLDYLEEQQLAVIQGGAGTGKTMLALEKARRLPSTEEVVFLCFNNLLMEYLRKQYNDYLPNVTFANLNSLAAKALNKQPTDQDIIYFLENFDEFKNVWKFKHIIIDEAQDFIDETVTLLKEISILQEGVFYVFYDKNQLVQRRDNLKWLDDMECRLVLSRNCRNTKSIAETSSKPIGLEKVKMRINLPGDITLYHNSKTKEELVNWLEKRIRYYTDNGVEKRQITILTLKTLSNSVLSDVKKIGSYSLVNEIDDKNITFTTARKFKGLEADVIFIVDIDAETFKNDENRRVFYVGASRAKSQLELISVLSDAEEKEMIYSLTKGTGRRRLLLSSNLKVKII
ncbi:ATP-dependent helicase, partial [Staphylococcus simulans]|uniref:ATP-binding domain-containing protein n=1 Tax=Staphylococcus simulans TaxID=1286 RepID=UPI000D1D1A08